MLEKTGLRNEVAILDNPQPGPDLAARIQDGDLITKSGFFEHPKTACEQAMFSTFRVHNPVHGFTGLTLPGYPSVNMFALNSPLAFEAHIWSTI